MRTEASTAQPSTYCSIGPSGRSSTVQSCNRSVNSAASSGRSTTPSPVSPCLRAFRRELVFHVSVLGPVLLSAFLRFAESFRSLTITTPCRQNIKRKLLSSVTARFVQHHQPSLSCYRRDKSRVQLHIGDNILRIRNELARWELWRGGMRPSKLPIGRARRMDRRGRP